MGLPLRISVLQKADRVVFAPLCFLLTRLRKLLPEPAADQPPKPKRIVIVKLAEQGSTVLAANAIRRATEMVGSENVYFAAFEENRFIVGCAAVDSETKRPHRPDDVACCDVLREPPDVTSHALARHRRGG